MQNSIDWANVGFTPRKTNAVAVSFYRDGKWSAPELTNDFSFSLSIYAGSLHYANSCFEGLKAFRGADGKVRLFRPYENARRLASSAAYLDMACPPEEMFVQMCLSCVKANLDFLPPYGYEASMYVRPLLL